jgi:hypothetical protein
MTPAEPDHRTPEPSPRSALWPLYRELCGEDRLLVEALREPAPDADVSDPARLAASGPRAAGRDGEYQLLMEMIYEGYRLHYRDGGGELVRPDDPDLALLLGDRLYALGLARLAGLGDLEAVAELADVISLVAQAHAAADPGLAEAVWLAGGTAVGWGASEAHGAAKTLARAGHPGAAQALRAAATKARQNTATKA